MRTDLRLIASSLFLVAGIAMASPATDYATAFALRTPEKADAYLIEATPALYAHGKADAQLRDMVVVNSLGMEVPAAAVPPAPDVDHPYALNARLLPVPGEAGERDGSGRIRRAADGSVQIDLGAGDLAARPPRHWIVDARRAITPARITLDRVDGADMQVDLAVDASNDLQQWDERVADATLTSIARGDDAVDSRSIPMSGEAARYYRLRVVSGQVPWSVEHTPGVKIEGSFIDTGDQRMAAMKWMQVTGTSDGKHGFVYELPAMLPVGAVRVTLADANGAARVQLSGRSTSDAWSPMGDVTATTVGKGDDGADTSLTGGHTIATTMGRAPANTLRIQDTRVHAIRLVSTPELAQAPTLRVGWTPDRFVFLAQGTGPYRVLVGSYTARRGDYPVDAALEKLRQDKGAGWQPPVATLGEAAVAAGDAAMQPARVPFDWTRPLLWGVLVLGALLVIFMAVSLLRSGRGSGRSQ